MGTIQKLAVSLLKNDAIVHTNPAKSRLAKQVFSSEPVKDCVSTAKFCTEEMQTARAMNKAAIRQTKKPVTRTYPQASAEDLRRLTSTTIEDSFARVEWTNPKDGKVYNILKQGETKDGKVAVRILNQNGGFIKEAELTPKTIGIPDNYSDTGVLYGLSHGELVNIFAKRSNPFAKYIPFNISKEVVLQHKELDEVFEYLKNGGKLDYLSCSYGSDVWAKKKLDFNVPPEKMKLLEECQQYDRLNKQGTRVLCSANNAQTTETAKAVSNDILVLNKNAEGVGSLNPKTGKISDFSMSRNSSLTQHYEVGEYLPVLTPHGINITGTTGTDIGFVSKKLETATANPLLNKTTERVKQLLDTINSRMKDIQQAKGKLFTSKKPYPEMVKEKALLDQQEMLYAQRRRKVFDYMGELSVVDGKYQVPLDFVAGTSFATPIRTAKLALNDMLRGIID